VKEKRGEPIYTKSGVMLGLGENRRRNFDGTARFAFVKL